VCQKWVLSEHRPAFYAHPVTSSGYHQVIAEARKRLTDGEDLQAVLALLGSRDLTLMSCIGAVQSLLNVGLAEAKRIVLDNPVFADARVGYDAFLDAVAEAETDIPD
jgi:hypothetical protein